MNFRRYGPVWIALTAVSACLLLANVCFLLALSGLPWFAHQLRTAVGSPNAQQLTRALDAVYTTRHASAQGIPTILLAGGSTSMHLQPDSWAGGAQVANGSMYGGGVYLKTALAKYYIDFSPADVVIVPLAWHSFDAVEDGPGEYAASTEWIPHLQDRWLRQGVGFGYLDGMPRQLYTLLNEQVVAARSHEVLLWPGGYPGPGYYQKISALPETAPVPSARAVQRLESLVAYGAERDVAVLYYLTPHNPSYFGPYVDRAAFGKFREALAPFLLADLGDAVAAEDFAPDFVHFNARGVHVVSAALGEALAQSNAIPASTRPRTPGSIDRATLSLQYVRDAWRAGFYAPESV